jgi:hypothetical protein
VQQISAAMEAGTPLLALREQLIAATVSNEHAMDEAGRALAFFLLKQQPGTCGPLLFAATVREAVEWLEYVGFGTKDTMNDLLKR